MIALLREADLFCCPPGRAGSATATGCRTSLMEAASQALPLVATRFRRHPGIRARRPGRRCSCRRATGRACPTPSTVPARDPAERAALGRVRASRGCAIAFAADAGPRLAGGAPGSASAAPARRRCARGARRDPARLLRAAEEPGPSGPVRRPDDGRACSWTRSPLAGFAPAAREHAAEPATASAIPARQAALAAEARPGGRPDRRARPRPRRRAAAAPLVHVPFLLQGAGPCRARRRAPARHPLRRRGGLPGHEARDGAVGRRARGVRGGARRPPRS